MFWDAKVRRMRLLGFNSIRVPFSFQDLFGTTPVDRSRPGVPNVTPADLRNNTRDPTAAVPAGWDSTDPCTSSAFSPGSLCFV